MKCHTYLCECMYEKSGESTCLHPSKQRRELLSEYYLREKFLKYVILNIPKIVHLPMKMTFWLSSLHLPKRGHTTLPVRKSGL